MKRFMGSPVEAAQFTAKVRARTVPQENPTCAPYCCRSAFRFSVPPLQPSPIPASRFASSCPTRPATPPTSSRPPPRETVAKPNAELGKVLSTAEMTERFAKQGTEVRTGTPGSLGQWMSTEQAKWAKVVKESGTKFE